MSVTPENNESSMSNSKNLKESSQLHVNKSAIMDLPETLSDDSIIDLTQLPDDPINKSNTHTKQKDNLNSRNQFSCDICQKVFLYPSQLKEHRMIHTGEKPYQCEICSKAYVNASKLKYHMIVHTDRQYKCTICEKEFLYENHLDRHIRTHTGEKPYECNDCGKTFARQDTLTDHYRSHTGEKPYGCEYCYKSYRRNFDLKKHKLKYHPHAKPHQARKMYI